MEPAVIAVVDDDPSILALIESVLVEEGYQVRIWSEGKTAYEFVRDQGPDLLILDVRMEHPQAGWLIMHMLRLNPQTAGIPVLICTGDLEYVRMRQQVLQAKPCDVLLKPFTVDDLLTKVEELLQGDPVKIGQQQAAVGGQPRERAGRLRKAWRFKSKLLQRISSRLRQ